MGFLDWYQRDRRLADYAPGEVRREEDRLRIRENQCLARLEKLESERGVIFRRGAAAGNPLRRRILARLFADRQRECEEVERELSRLTKESLAVAAIRFRIERRLDGDSGALKKVSAADIDALAEPWADPATDEETFAGLLKEALGKVSKGKRDPLKGLDRRARNVLEVWQRFDRGELPDVEAALSSVVREEEE